MAGDTMQLHGVHDSGNAKLNIGIRSNKFFISRSDDLVSVRDSASLNLLDLQARDFITADTSMSELDERLSFVEGVIGSLNLSSILVNASGYALANASGSILVN